VGRFFSTFGEAWESFLEREEPLEDFFGSFPEQDADLTVWLASPGPEAAAEAKAVQQALDGVEGLLFTPGHWLHVALGLGREDDLELVRERLHRFGSFDAEYGPAACFHDALVLEVHSPRLKELATAIDPARDVELFLPHVSFAYVTGTPDPSASRARLIPLRRRPSVRGRIREVQLCVVPVPRAELLSPWRVAGVVPLD
jgi:hypothetical protein